MLSGLPAMPPQGLPLQTGYVLSVVTLSGPSAPNLAPGFMPCLEQALTKEPTKESKWKGRREKDK